MHRILLALGAALALSACAEPAPTLSPAQLGAASADAMVMVCQRKRSGQSQMTPAWDAYCKGRGL